jgi:ribosomal protein S18 acetylase RimI-like enzyme
MRVRELEGDEWRLWRELRLSALQDSPEAFGMTYEAQARMDDETWEHLVTDRATDPSIASFIAETEGTPIGMAVCRLDPDHPTVAHVFAMWVAPVARRKGAGRALVDACTRWARSKDATEVELQVTEGNEAAIALYRTSGFIDTGRREPLREGSELQTLFLRRKL